MPPVQCTCAVAFICVHKGEFILRYPTIPLFRYFAIPLFRYFAFITESSPLRTVGPAQKSASGGRGKPANH